ncbi:MAG TPA: molybdopterin converting factor subunit 1 [Ktedonobacterales bacterium]
MRITMRYFAALREATGREAETLELPAGADVAAAREALLTRYPALARLLPRCAIARNRAYVNAETALADGDELAFIPPVGGG